MGESITARILLYERKKRRYHKLEKRTFSVPNISCGHCTMTIENELGELDGVKAVKGDAQNKTVTVEWDSPTTLQNLKDTLNEINYPAV
jgi:copper ion binding protein